ncbi:hypothetical protein C7H19_20255 [Aphanothece hegewaldii CCALA 016]|uniref:Uncharacterized protein n=1 Tax=Aphanothece hegewaldii CCALA 016 TaxID=2107694 RepID=A0A2T1LT00_9CHRO|nr:hypothetical protein [Aphanothece hegewaldii]PSF33333.1 hypothetical protein C7H19_20255 [Aphanothece hegewaldii CCALA 016]
MTTIENGEAIQGTQTAQQLENESMRLMFTAINQLAVTVSVLIEEVRALRQKTEEQQQNPSQEQQQDSAPEQANDLSSPLSPALQQQSSESEALKNPQSKTETVVLPPELTLKGFNSIPTFTPIKAEDKETSTEQQITALYAIQQTLTNSERVRDEAVRTKFSGLNRLVEGAREIASSITTAISKGIEWLKENFNSRSLAEDLKRQSTVTHFANRLLDSAGHRYEDGRVIVQGTNYRFERDVEGSITITDTSKQQRGELFSVKQGVLVDHLQSKDLNHFLKAAQVLKSQEQQPKGAER